MDPCWSWRSDWLLCLDCSAPCCTLNWCCVIMQHTLHHHIDRLIMILQIIICLLLHHLVIEIERKQNLFESLLRSHMTSVLKRIFEYIRIFEYFLPNIDIHIRFMDIFRIRILFEYSNILV